MDIRELRDKIQNFRLEDGDLGSQGYTRVLLQLFGYTGHGKSAFINSCKYVLEGGERFTEYAEARERPDGGAVTMIRNAYPLTDVITIVDNRGCSRMNDFERAEVYVQLGNFIPIGKKVDWRDNFRAMMEDIGNSELEPNFTYYLVPIFVYRAEQWIHKKEMEEVKTFMKNCVTMTGIVPIVVLTFKTRGDYLEIEKQFKLMGAETVIAIENYTKINHIKTPGTTTDILMVIYKALENVRYRLDHPRDPRKERIGRKIFLLNYIHEISAKQERERERERQERERQERKRQARKRQERQREQEEQKKMKTDSWCTVL